jgi:hypothetical protein
MLQYILPISTKSTQLYLKIHFSDNKQHSVTD